MISLLDTELQKILIYNRELESELRSPTEAANIPNPQVFFIEFILKPRC